MLDFVRDEMKKHAKVVVGNFNIAPEDIDVHDPKKWEGEVLVSEPERLAFQKLLRYCLIDSIRMHHSSQDNLYSCWDYRAGAFRRQMGLPIDHILLSASLHAPVWVSLNL